MEIVLLLLVVGFAAYVVFAYKWSETHSAQMITQNKLMDDLAQRVSTLEAKATTVENKLAPTGDIGLALKSWEQKK